MKPILLGLFVPVVASFLFGFACDSESEMKYDVAVGWTITDQQICATSIQSAPGSLETETVALDHLEITLYTDEDYRQATHIDEVRVAWSGEVSCSDQEYVFENLPRGKYWAVVWGYAQRAADTEAYQYFQAEGELLVPAIDNDVTYFDLGIGKGDIDVTWDFVSFGERCGANATVKLTLEGLSPKNNYTSSEPVDCNAQNILLAGRSWDIYEVKLEAFDSDGLLTHMGTCVNKDMEDIESFELHPGEKFPCTVALREI
ncbi:MAG: hypothetical protein MUC50_07710 [Myxococcota bacterium]|jgi:hypothetical protein|nr:hypothetical protein [Myxococcota bacterium]